MAMIRCTQGHYYEEREGSCPNCNSSSNNFGGQWSSDDGVTSALGVTMPVSGETQPLRTPPPVSNSAPPVYSNPQPFQNDEGVTVGIMKKKMNFDPVVGWLVCVEGSQRGRDYRIYSGKNSIGRSDRMRVVIQGDGGISRDNHAFIVHDPRRNIFRIQAGESRELVYLNDNEVEMSSELKIYDVIELGCTKLVFVPLCSEKFKWE